MESSASASAGVIEDVDLRGGILSRCGWWSCPSFDEVRWWCMFCGCNALLFSPNWVQGVVFILWPCLQDVPGG